MTIPSMSSAYFREELDRLHHDIRRVESRIPEKPEYQKELDSLRDRVMAKDATIHELQNTVGSLLSINEKLLEYINSIDAIRNAGGVRIDVKFSDDVMKPRVIQTKIVTIPEVKIAVIG